jgi:hypothetical protein
VGAFSRFIFAAGHSACSLETGMRVMCAWCEQEGRRRLIGQVGRNDRLDLISHGICAHHERAMLRKIAKRGTAHTGPAAPLNGQRLSLTYMFLYLLLGMVGIRVSVLLYKKRFSQSHRAVDSSTRPWVYGPRFQLSFPV